MHSCDLDLLLPAIRPIQPFLEDGGISEIMINPGNRVFIERNGAMQDVTSQVDFARFDLSFAALTVARLIGENIDETRPLLDARLPDGSRIAIAFPPVSVDGIAITIRKFRNRRFTLDELVQIGSLPSHVADFLSNSVRNRRTVLLSGGTGSGKTTFLNALIDHIDPSERLGVIEDTPELALPHPNVFRFQSRREQKNIEAISIRDLVKATLRHRPDRILIGEVRGAEAWDFLQALNTGHPGSLCTIHAESPRKAFSRLAALTLQAETEMPYRAIQTEIGELISIIVQIGRNQTGQRHVIEVFEVEGFDPDRGRYEGKTVYAFERTEDGAANSRAMMVTTPPQLHSSGNGLAASSAVLATKV
jgi:pilus assembly protein CpaF